MEEGRLVGLGGTREFSPTGHAHRRALTGCKNIVDARRQETRVYVRTGALRWTRKPVGDGLVAIGIRAHHFGGDISENSFTIRAIEEIEEPFEWTVKFMYETQKDDSARLVADA